MNRFQAIDFERVYKVLSIKAHNIVRHYRVPNTFDGGLDSQDVLNEVLREFFDSPDGLGWKASKGSIESFLGKVLHNKIVDHLRRQKHVADALDVVEPAGGDGRFAVSPERSKVDLIAQLYALVGDDTDLRDLIAAAEMTSGGPNVNQELGEVLNKTPHQVSKLKERLLRKEGVKELYASRKATKTRV